MVLNLGPSYGAAGYSDALQEELINRFRSRQLDLEAERNRQQADEQRARIAQAQAAQTRQGQIDTRTAAIENVGMQNGTPAADIGYDNAERPNGQGGFVNVQDTTPDPTQPRAQFDMASGQQKPNPLYQPENPQALNRFKATPIPGVGASGPGMLRAKTAEEMARTKARAAEDKFQETSHVIGNNLYQGDELRVQGPEKPDTRSLEQRYAEATSTGDQAGAAGWLGAMRQQRDASTRPPASGGGMGGGGMNALYSQVDPKAIGEAIVRGDREPDTGNLGRPVTAAVDSYLAARGYNKTRALREWKAQIKLNATMNGSQQVRLDESIRSGLAMYDKIDELAAAWNGQGLGPLSRANLAAAQQGALGQKAQSQAIQLTGAIGQLTSDVATIEQGGLTPTNESRGIAERSMKDWWGTGTIQAMTEQGRWMMQARHTARNTQDVMVPGNGFDTSLAKPATPQGETKKKVKLVNGVFVPAK